MAPMPVTPFVPAIRFASPLPVLFVETLGRLIGRAVSCDGRRAQENPKNKIKKGERNSGQLATAEFKEETPERRHACSSSVMLRSRESVRTGLPKEPILHGPNARVPLLRRKMAMIEQLPCSGRYVVGIFLESRVPTFCEELRPLCQSSQSLSS